MIALVLVVVVVLFVFGWWRRSVGRGKAESAVASLFVGPTPGRFDKRGKGGLL